MFMDSKFNIKVKAPSELAYITELGHVQVLPVLEIAKRDKLWGIKCGNIIVALKNSKFNNWIHAMKSERVLSPKWKISLPLVDDLCDCYAAKDNFRKTLDFLHVHSVDADDWLDGWYWSGEETGFDSDTIHTFDMKDGMYSKHDRRDNNGFVRYALVRLPE